MIFVFREEREGPAGLKKIKDRTDTSFTLAVDLNKKSSQAYSSRNRTFDNYVVDKKGNVKAVIPGTLRDRATADLLIKNFKEIEGK